MPSARRAAKRRFRAGSSSSSPSEKAALLGMDMDMLKRPVNVGFSGGEKKRAEMVQMGILDPKPRDPR
jgi:Fe-S cluster assembly ATP-binding protein